MLGLINHIDVIACREGRAAPYLEFHPQAFSKWRRYRYGDDPMRAAVLAPYGECLADYCRLRDYLEYLNGTLRHADVRFCLTPLDYALRNAAHDAQDFWESVEKNF